MYIGVLNDKYKEIKIEYFKKNLKKIPLAEADGNPFRGENLFIKWDELTSNGLDLFVSLSDDFYVNNVVITFGEKSAPHGIALMDPKKEKCYDSYRAETGLNITKTCIPLSVEGKIRDFVIEFDSDFSHVNIQKIEIFGAAFEGEKVLPIPAKMEMTEGKVPLEKLATVSSFEGDGEMAFGIFTDKFFDKTGLEAALAEDGFVRFLYDAKEEANGYALEVGLDGVVLSASDRKGLVQGVETIIKLMEEDGIPCCKIADKPFCEFRGVHLFLPAEDQMDFAKRLIRDVLSPMGYNLIILQLSAAMEFDSHPEINRGFLTAIEKSNSGEWPAFPHAAVGGGKLVSKAAVRDFVEFSRQYGIDVVPEVQSLGHVQYITISHPEIAEIAEEEEGEKVDEMVADVRPKTFYKHSACPSNPKTYEILFDILDEIIEVVQPREYVHMGHDEVYEIGVCPICKHRDPSDLLAEDLNRIHAHLAEKGLKMMIWADMLQNCTKYITYGAINKIPKDILLLDFIWYFHRTKDIENFLLENEFEILFGNMYSSHFPRFEKRIRKNGVRGGQISAWVKTAEKEMAREGKLYDFLYGGIMMWSDCYSSHCRYSYDRILSEQIPEIRAKLRGKPAPSEEDTAKTISILDGDVLKTKACENGKEFKVGQKLRSLILEQASSDFLRRYPWTENVKIGSYLISYEDGTSAEIDLCYGDQICYWDRRQNEPFEANYYRHNGYTSTWICDGVRVMTDTGKEGTIYRYEWVNPSPEKEIDKITFVSVQDVDSGVLVHKISGIL